MDIDTTNTLELRNAMVDRLRESGIITDTRVENAMRRVPRHLFIPQAHFQRAYTGESVVTHRDEQGVATSSASEAGIVAVMLQQLDVQPGHRILEIGAGTGYNAALLAQMTGPSGVVTSIDIDAEVTREAREHLTAAGYDTVRVVCGDGDLGDVESAPFDRIIVTAGAWDLPHAWREQLAPGGVLVVPLRMRGLTRSLALQWEDGRWRSRSMHECGFMPIRGLGGVAERNVQLGGDSGVFIRTDEGREADPEALGAALKHPPTLRWTGAITRNAKHVDLWLSHLDGFCRMIATAPALERGLVRPIYPWGSMAVVTSNSFAYLLQRPSGADDLIELGVCAYGPDSNELAAAVAKRVTAWQHAQSSLSDLWVEVYPAGVANIPEGVLNIAKRNTHVVIRSGS